MEERECVKYYINRLLWVLFVGCFVTTVIASSNGDKNEGDSLFPFKHTYINDDQEPAFFNTPKYSEPPTNAEYLLGLLENVYGHKGPGAELVDEYIALVNQIYPFAVPYTRPEELAQFGFIAPGTIDPELTDTWFVCRFILIPEAQREAYFSDRIRRLEARGSWTQDYIKDLERIHKRAIKGDISLSYLRILCIYNLISNRALMQILSKFDIVSIEFLKEAALRLGLVDSVPGEQTPEEEESFINT